jgi:hypothetical protein
MLAELMDHKAMWFGCDEEGRSADYLNSMASLSLLIAI